MHRILAPSRRPPHLAVAILISALSAALPPADVTAQAQRPAPAPARDSSRARTLALGVSEGFTLAAVGDMIETHPVSTRAGLADLVALIQGASVAFGNFESSAIDIRTFPGYPQAEFGGLWVRSEPEGAKDVKAMGFDLVARATNHSTDWGVEGMRETDRRRDEAGVGPPGHGRTRAGAPA